MIDPAAAFHSEVQAFNAILNANVEFPCNVTDAITRVRADSDTDCGLLFTLSSLPAGMHIVELAEQAAAGRSHLNGFATVTDKLCKLPDGGLDMLQDGVVAVFNELVDEFYKLEPSVRQEAPDRYEQAVALMRSYIAKFLNTHITLQLVPFMSVAASTMKAARVMVAPSAWLISVLAKKALQGTGTLHCNGLDEVLQVHAMLHQVAQVLQGSVAHVVDPQMCVKLTQLMDPLMSHSFEQSALVPGIKELRDAIQWIADAIMEAEAVVHWNVVVSRLTAAFEVSNSDELHVAIIDKFLGMRVEGDAACEQLRLLVASAFSAMPKRRAELLGAVDFCSSFCASTIGYCTDAPLDCVRGGALLARICTGSASSKLVHARPVPPELLARLHADIFRANPGLLTLETFTANIAARLSDMSSCFDEHASIQTVAIGHIVLAMRDKLVPFMEFSADPDGKEFKFLAAINEKGVDKNVGELDSAIATVNEFSKSLHCTPVDLAANFTEAQELLCEGLSALACITIIRTLKSKAALETRRQQMKATMAICQNVSRPLKVPPALQAKATSL
jgi:hypothetical protein